ncbi:MAG: hypothetical protein M1812_002697 [Candelaria pacifica]|nr:MAG: hypothetical protein M1812_002697 [Candelaria pacifica]
MDIDQILLPLSGDKVDIYVGPNRVHFHLPKDVLCRQSSYFDLAFNGDFKEGKEQSLELPDEDVETFKQLIHWMIMGTLSASMVSVEPGSQSSAADDQATSDTNLNIEGAPSGKKHFSYNESFPVRLDLYTLADRLCIAALKNTVIDELVKHCETHRLFITPLGVKRVFSATPTSSPLRKFVYKTTACAFLVHSPPMETEEIQKYLDVADNFAAGLISTMAECAQEMKDPQRFHLGGGCTFHDHTDGKPCGGLRVTGYFVDPLLCYNCNYCANSWVGWIRTTYDLGSVQAET